MRRISLTTISLAGLLLSGCSILPPGAGGTQSCPAPAEQESDPNVIMDMARPSLSEVLNPESVQLSQDGTQLAAMHGNQILVWNEADGGSPSYSVGEATHPLDAGPMAASPDFSQFALRAADDVIRVVSADGASQQIELEDWHEHEDISQLEISPDGERLAVRGSSGIIALYAMENHELQMTLPACTDSAGEISFSPDSSQLFAASRNDATTVWDLQTQETVLELQSDDVYYTHGAWSHDGSRLAVSATSFGHGPEDHWNLTLVDTEAWEMIRTYPELSPTATAFFPDDEELLVATGATSIQRWQIGDIPEELSTGVVNDQTNMSPDGSTAYVADRETLVGFNLEAAEIRVTYDIPDFDCDEIARPQIFEECS